MIGIIGAGGHAKVITDIFKQSHSNRIIFFATLPNPEPFFTEFVMKHDHPDELSNWSEVISLWHVAIGDIQLREKKTVQLERFAAMIGKAIHPKSIIANSVKMGAGTSVMAGAIINPDTLVGKGCIINTASSIDHDCQIGDYVNISPGCHLAGGVTVGSRSIVGTGALVVPNVTIGSNCKIGAGSVVTKNIPDHVIAYGVPAKIIKEN